MPATLPPPRPTGTAGGCISTDAAGAGAGVRAAGAREVGRGAWLGRVLGLGAARAGLHGADEQGLDGLGAAFGGVGEVNGDRLVRRVYPQVRRLGRAAG